METVTTIAAVRAQVRAWRTAGLRVGFVPTMGNLHPGHVSLIDAAREHSDRFVASIFVNPMQFGPNEDFAHYPRTPQADQQMLAAAGCNLMFMPEVTEIYPQGADRGTRVEVPGLSRILEGEYRPGHFEGVTTVVAKLLHIVEPDLAVFGEKDFQQLTIIRRMVAELCMPVQLIAAPTVREPDGLAMSSRNQYLTDEERRLAPAIHATLQAAAQRLVSGADFTSIERDGVQALERAGLKPDYFAIRQCADLTPASVGARELVVLCAVRFSRARLIDNLRVSRP